MPSKKKSVKKKNPGKKILKKPKAIEPEVVKEGFGRPTKYHPKYCKEIMDYFDREPYTEREKTITDKYGTRTEYVDNPSDLPTLAGFAVSIGVHRETLNNWGKEHKEFFDAIKKAKELQYNILVTNGLRGNYATAFAIFTAKNIIGWKDKQEHSVDEKTRNDLKLSYNLPATKQIEPDEEE